MNANEAALTMNLADYRLWWYEQLKITPPEPNERLTVRQTSDERLIREGWHYRRQVYEQRAEKEWRDNGYRMLLQQRQLRG